MILALLVILCTVLFIAYYANKRDIISPSVVFCASFVFSAIWALAYSDIWELQNMQTKTILVIAGGTIVFLFFSTITRLLYEKYSSHKECEMQKSTKIYINPVIKIGIVILFVATLILCLASVIKAVNSNWGNIPQAIKNYNDINKFSDDFVSIGKIPSILKTICTAITYWFIYFIINNYYASKKIDIYGCLIVLLGISISLTTGGRNAAVNILISIIPLLILMRRTNSLSKKKNRLKFKNKLLIALSIIGLFIAFPKVNTLLGREVTGDSTYYLAIYCGAEIKNLDIFVEQYDNGSFYLDNNNMTFKNFNNWLGTKLGYIEPYKFYLPFQSINGNSLGNVYTTFYAYIYDFGYNGIVWCVALMAIITQIIYEASKRSKKHKTPSIAVLIYGYFFSSIALSFFSNKFYEQNFSAAFVQTLLTWAIFNFIIDKTSQSTKKELHA